MSAISIIIIDLLFGIWGAVGKAWYWYILNFIILFTVSGIINASFFQCITRCYSVIILKGKKWVGESIGLLVLTLVFWSIGYFICRIVFQNYIQIGLFFLACLVISTIVAVIDNQFQVAIERTKFFEELGNKIKQKERNKNTGDRRQNTEERRKVGF